MRKNIFIEGMQGSGKSTLLTNLSKALPEYHAYREGDISPAELAWCSYMTKEEFEQALAKFPDLKEEIQKKTVTEGQTFYITAYTQILAERRDFYEYMERYEIYNGRVSFSSFHDTIMNRYQHIPDGNHLFECSFLQNSLESMMLFYQMSDADIVEFYKEAYDILKKKQFVLLYLDSKRLRENLLQIKKERSDVNGVELWYPLMLNYLKDSPYGREHGYTGLEDMLSHFERRRELELKIIQEITAEDTLILQSKNYDIMDVLERL